MSLHSVYCRSLEGVCSQKLSIDTSVNRPVALYRPLGLYSDLLQNNQLYSLYLVSLIHWALKRSMQDAKSDYPQSNLSCTLPQALDTSIAMIVCQKIRTSPRNQANFDDYGYVLWLVSQVWSTGSHFEESSDCLDQMPRQVHRNFSRRHKLKSSSHLGSLIH